jgi:hypothetical protein
VSSLADLEPFLARVAEQLEATGSAAEIYDREWNLVWLTSQFRFFAGDRPLEQLGLSQHPVTVRTESLDGMVPFETGIEWMRKYRTVGELPGVTPKAVRDAGGVPVVVVPRRRAI